MKSKKFNILKSVQLVILIVVTAIGLTIIFRDEELYHNIAVNSHVRALCILLWIALIISFVFMFLDYSLFSTIRRNYSELDYALHSDPVAGISNRYSCDAYIEKYAAGEVPEDVGCVMLELSNIREINKLYGHAAGNRLIRDFSAILKLASVELCFVGRNGGNKFLAIFENADKDKLKTYLLRINNKVRVHNMDSEHHPIEFKYGVAIQERDKVNEITELIALSDRRIQA